MPAAGPDRAADAGGPADALRAAEEKMRAAGVPEPGIVQFRRRYERLARGERGLLAGDELEPVGEVPGLEDLRHGEDRAGHAALDRAVVVKLNGGLGTSMGLRRPKSLIEVRPGLSFLDVIVRQVMALRARYDVRLPLVLMNSLSTRDETLAALERHPRLPADVPLDFLQSRQPKLLADELTPVDWPADPALEWCPPGHGDLYADLAGSGLLDALLERGYQWALVSNVDNLGAVPDPRIVAWLDRERPPFLMEVVEGTEADRKGGHIALRGGRLVLRETAQTPEGDASFTDFERWRFYNTNNVWLRLPDLAGLLRERGGALDLPLIANRKTVDPGDPSSPAVVQLETAMGAALGVIDGARVLRVPRSRFVPVKTTDDLLVVRSDAYELRSGDGVLAPARERGERPPPYVALDPRFYKLLESFEARFPHGPPSLLHAERLVVRGDVTFGAGSAIAGEAEVSA